MKILIHIQIDKFINNKRKKLNSSPNNENTSSTLHKANLIFRVNQN